MLSKESEALLLLKQRPFEETQSVVSRNLAWLEQRSLIIPRGPLAAVSTQAAGSPIRGVVVSAGLAPSLGKSPVVPMDWRSLLLAACLTSSLLQAWTAEVHQSLAHADSPEKSDLIPSQGANSSTPST